MLKVIILINLKTLKIKEGGPSGFLKFQFVLQIMQKMKVEHLETLKNIRKNKKMFRTFVVQVVVEQLNKKTLRKKTAHCKSRALFFKSVNCEMKNKERAR